MSEQLLPVVIHDSIMSAIYSHFEDKKNHSGVTYAIYAFLYHTARRQNNIRVYATDTFIKKGTGIGDRSLRLAKKALIEMDLLEVIHDRKNGGVFGKRYIEVKFVWKPEALEKLFYQEQNETTEYKIARALLINNFNPYEEIELNDECEFDVVVNGNDVTLFANTFYFNDDSLLLAIGYLHSDMDDESRFDYTITTDRMHDVIMSLAGSYKFSFNGILNTLNSDKYG